MYVLGLDIGTSTIDVVVFTDKGKILLQESEQYNLASFESTQSPDVITDRVRMLLEKVWISFPPQNISGMGISNQMHGIVYVDRFAHAVSPLYNWQDKRADQVYKENKTYTEYVKEVSGYYVPTGYGLMTHFYNVHNNVVPSHTYYILDIGSYVASQLSETLIRTIHPSNAQSWGFYCIDTNEFDTVALRRLGLNEHMLPSVSTGETQVGAYKDIPIYLPIGDNQAGVFSAIENSTEFVLINLGTSGQISFLYSEEEEHKENFFSSPTQLLVHGWERRPFINNETLWVACSLCGGKTLDLWVEFIADSILQIMESHSLDKKAIRQQVYSYLHSLTRTESSIEILPFFYGTRENPSATADISKLSFKNFKLEDMSIALIKSIVDELYGYWSCLPHSIRNKKKSLLITGGAIQTPLVRTIIKNKFDDLSISSLHRQTDAAVGAAKWALYNLNEK